MDGSRRPAIPRRVPRGGAMDRDLSRDSRDFYGSGSFRRARYGDNGVDKRFPLDPPEVQCSTIWVGGCPHDITEREVTHAFSRYGPVLDVSIKTSSRDTFVFVTFRGKRHARNAICDMDQTQLFGVIVKVAPASRPPNKAADDYRDNDRYGPRELDYSAGFRRDELRRGREVSWDRGRGRTHSRDIIDGRRSRSLSLRRGPHRHPFQRPPRTQRSLEPISRLQARRPQHTSFENGTHLGRAGQLDGKQEHFKSSLSLEPSPELSTEKSTKIVSSCNGKGPVGGEPKLIVNKQRRGQVRLNLWQLPDDFEEEELLEIASDYGTVLSHEFWQEKKQMCAMLEYETRDQAMDALKHLHNRKMDGWHMLLKALVCD